MKKLFILGLIFWGSLSQAGILDNVRDDLQRLKEKQQESAPTIEFNNPLDNLWNSIPVPSITLSIHI